MNFKRTKEFDAFGPWIYEIGSEHELPALFEDYRNSTEEALMLFKIPRQIERRNANPEMHLYDAVIGIFETYMLMLYRKGEGVQETRVMINAIDAIRVTQCLLNGSLVLYTDNRVYTISYNTVSQSIIKKSVDLIRNLQKLSQHETRLSPMSYSIETIEYLYVNLINDLKKTDGNIQLIAYQPNMKIDRKKGLRALFQRHPNLQCTAFLHNKKEIILISRTTDFHSHEKTSYSYTFSYIPIKNISGIKRVVCPEDSAKTVLNIRVGKHLFSVLYDDFNTNIKHLYEELR